MENKLQPKQAAMWVKKTKAGNDYYSIRIEMVDGLIFWVNLFYNKFKKDEKHPSFVTIEDKENKSQNTDSGIPF